VIAVVLERRPAYVPDGYALRYTVEGGREPGLGWVAEQTLLVYTRGWSRTDFSVPLVVVVGRPDAPDLVGTSADFGLPFDVDVPGVRTTYHDGTLVPLLDATREFRGTHWQSGTVHSLTARSEVGTFAVRGPRALPRSELVAVLLSLSPGG
jgi:hypothetical protein